MNLRRAQTKRRARCPSIGLQFAKQEVKSAHDPRSGESAIPVRLSIRDTELCRACRHTSESRLHPGLPFAFLQAFPYRRLFFAHSINSLKPLASLQITASVARCSPHVHVPSGICAEKRPAYRTDRALPSPTGGMVPPSLRVLLSLRGSSATRRRGIASR